MHASNEIVSVNAYMFTFHLDNRFERVINGSFGQV